MNTTPLIDVMLVLLVMLIVTIPIQTHAVKLDLPVTGGPPVVVRGDHNSNAPAVGHGVLYFAAYAAPEFGSMDWEIRRASPEDGPSEFIARVDGNRVPS